MSGPRIAVSGSAGTGKTSLGRHLARELGLPFVEEGMRARLEAGLDLHELGLEGWAALIEELWEEHRAAQAAAPDGFVADRSSLDFAAFWLHYDLCALPERSADFLARMRAAAADYDLVVMLPWGALPLEHDGVRTTNPWVQLRFQLLVEGVSRKEIPAGRLLALEGAGSLEERARQVRSALEAAGEQGRNGAGAPIP